MLNEEWEKYATETGAIKNGKTTYNGLLIKLGFYASANVIMKRLMEGTFNQMDVIADIVDHTNSIRQEIDELKALHQEEKAKPDWAYRQFLNTAGAVTGSSEDDSQGIGPGNGDEQS